MQCWRCGAEVRPGERVCGNCGARLTSPPGGRPQRPSQQRSPAPRQSSRRPYDDEWESDGGAGYDRGGESAYGAAYPPDDRSYDRPRDRAQDRRGGRKGSRPDDDGDWQDWDESRPDRQERPDRRRQPRGRSRPGQEPEDYAGGRYAQSDYGQSGADIEEYPSSDYAAPAPDPRDDPLNDPRAPRSLRSTPRRGPDSRSGRSQGDPDRGHRERGYGQESMGGMGGAPYDDPGRPRRSQPSSADNRYGRPSTARGQQAPYDDGYGGQGYDDGYGGYGDSYGGAQQPSRQGYERNTRGDRYGRGMPQDDQSWYHQVGARAREIQQRWGETFNSIRIPGVTRQEEDGGKASSSSRRVITTVVVLLVLLVAVVAGGIVVAPRLLNRLHPSATTSSTLCTVKGAATPGTPPTPDAHFKQFTSARSQYGMNYPETWTVEPQQKVANGYDYIDIYTLPNSSTSASIEQAQAACALTDSAIIQGEVAAAQQQNITFTETTSAAQTQTIGGEQWQRREYDVSDKGVSLHMVILACHHQGRAYVIVLVSKTTSFKQDDSGIFEPMLKSFTFTK